MRRPSLSTAWAAWLARHYADDAALLAAWGPTWGGSRPGDRSSNPAMPMYVAWELGADGPVMNASEARRVGDFISFLAETQRDGYLRRATALQDAGFDGVIVGTAWQSSRPKAHLANMWTDDAIDRHDYVGGGVGNWQACPRDSRGTARRSADHRFGPVTADAEAPIRTTTPVQRQARCVTLPFVGSAAMNLDEALRRGDNLVAAWDLNAEDGKHDLTVFDVTAGAKPVTTLAVPEADVEAITASLAARGVRVGRYDRHLTMVWVVSRNGVQAWNEDKQVIDARDGVLRDRLQRDHPVSTLKAIRGYVQDDYVDRGLLAERVDGTRPTLCYLLSAHAGADPTYNRNDFLMDSGWIGALGSAIARWAGKPFYGA